MSVRAEKFDILIDNVAREIVGTEHGVGWSFIRMPLLYPSGSTVVVRVEHTFDRYFVSDWGLGHEESELYGAGHFYRRQAKSIAERAGIGFDNHAFFILECSRDQLAGAVVTVGNCSQEAAMRATDALAEKTFQDSKERLYERVFSVIEKECGPATDKIVLKNRRIVGHSTTEWPVATIVIYPGTHRPAIFEPVTKNLNSIAHAVMKFQDIALLGSEAPTRVVLVPTKKEMGTFLGVLSHSAKVIDESASDETILSLVKAA